MTNKQETFDLTDLADSINTSGMNAVDREDLIKSLKEKLGEGGVNQFLMDSLSPAVKKRVDFLRELQAQHDKLEAEFYKEKAALEAKYQKQYEPLYTKRSAVVTGAEEVEGVTNDTMDQDGAAEDKGIPDFWLTAMKSNEILVDEITEKDEETLKFLKDIKSCKLDDPKGFKLEFFFDTNPFFKNTVLTKTYHMIEEEDPILERAIGTEIEWYPGKCLTQKVLKKKPKKGSKNTKPITKTEKVESFFNFFNPPEVPEGDEDISDEVAEELQSAMEADYDIGSTIRDKIITHAVSWFTGEAVEDGDVDDDDDDEEEDDEDEDEEDDDEDDDEDEDDEDDEEAPTKSVKKVGKAQIVGKGQPNAGEQPPECKQQ